jgi:glycosyltransferase involved in cell wall biosynthesis
LVDIIIVASNSIIRHPRISKIVESLKKKYNLTVLGWNREGISSKELNSYFVRLNLLNFRAPFGRPSLILYYPYFWIWVLIKLLKYKPQVVHAIDLDTLLPCLLYKFVLRKKLFYDVHDRFAGYVPPNFTRLYTVVNLLEELLSKETDVLVTVSEKVLRTFRHKPKQSVVIMNCSENIKLNRKDKNDIFTLVYTGVIYKNLGLERITAAIKELKDVKLIIAGRIGDKELFDEIIKLPNVEYKGILERNESLQLEADADVMVVLYNLNYPKNRLSSPNKIFEALMCGTPLVTNMEQDLVNNELECGIIVDYDDLKQIKEAIIRLRDDPELRRIMGQNGRRAFEQRYNWNRMEQKLYEIYDKLMIDS